MTKKMIASPPTLLTPKEAAKTTPRLCGYHVSNIKQCRCSPPQIENHLAKISGPLLDRIAIHHAANQWVAENTRENGK
jgi:predicted ATPase with chaperone activity